MSSHKTIPGVYGPGTFADTEFIPLPKDCPRLLKWLAGATPGLNADPKVLEEIEFIGQDLPMLPGPLKAQALVAVLQAIAGIVMKEISAMKGFVPLLTLISIAVTDSIRSCQGRHRKDKRQHRPGGHVPSDGFHRDHQWQNTS